jgi:hypothetical protein
MIRALLSAVLQFPATKVIWKNGGPFARCLRASFSPSHTATQFSPLRTEKRLNAPAVKREAEEDWGR